MKWIFFYSEVWLYVVNVLLSKIVWGPWRDTYLISAFRRQRQQNLCEFEANFVFRVSFRPYRLKSETLLQNKQKISMNLWVKDRFLFLFLTDLFVCI